MVELNRSSSRLIPLFSCEKCEYGIYNHHDNCWEDGCGAVNELECKERFVKRKIKYERCKIR